MSKANSYEAAILACIYQNANIANLGDATGVRGSTAAGTIKVALHTADPGEAGSQSTSEIAYTGYARATVVRSAAGFTLSGTAPTQIANAAIVNWPACTAGSGTATFFSFGDDSGNIIHSGALSSSLAISAGITPSAAIGALVATED